MQGTLENIVYFGTDTHYHRHLADGSVFTIRQQNRPGGAGAFAVGADVGVTVGRRMPPGSCGTDA